MQENVFWGAGKIGQEMCRLWKFYGISPDYIFDNNRELVGTYCYGLMISEKEKIRELKNPRIFITCRHTEEIGRQLQREYGYTDIIECDDITKMISYLLHNKMIKLESLFCMGDKKYDVLMDLENGIVLGGVESWVFESSALLNKMGYTCRHISTDFQEDTIVDNGINSIEIPYVESGCAVGLNLCSKEIIKHLPCNIVCNFAGLTILSACVAKAIAGDKLNVIAVVHNDEEGYYSVYAEMESYIDKCLVISSLIKKKLIARGFPEKKCFNLPWKITIGKHHIRSYSEKENPIRLGYAGRIVKEKKRIDYILLIAKYLKEKGISYILEIAGEGDYKLILEDEIRNQRLQNFVHYVGVVKRQEIGIFWQHQDMMLSCSEWEGNSITQCEAMAAGAVPIVTDVSGARDDVDDGENGFIVDVGATDQIVEKVCFLYEHRELLSIMGKKAYETMKQKSDGVNLEEFWKSILI